MTTSREWPGRAAVLLALAVTVALPFALRKDEAPALRADDVVVVITPHNEAIRSEFARGFSQAYHARTGRTVAVDWRVIGGTAEITRFLAGEYTNSFRLHWERDLHRPWSAEVQKSFDDGRIVPDATPADDTTAEAARRAFLASEASCGIDLFFGGGSYDFIRQASAGRLVDSGIFERHPGWFTDDVIPEMHNGERFWSADHTWIGAVLSSFGILYNTDSLRRLGIERPLSDWRDLADPRLLGELALADPTKSSSIAKAFEMVIQREMQVRQRELRAAGLPEAEVDRRAVAEGWAAAMREIQLMGANARYFTDTSQKPPIDVAQGDSAAGMCIDFYGRFQAEAVRRRDNSARAEFVTPPAGSVYSVDPIALMRGSPHRAVAVDFIEYVLSPEGQDLWNTRVGEPGGPAVFALRRLPVRKDSYAPETRPRRSDPAVDPYAADNDFVYNGAWTGSMLNEIAFVIRVMCLDSHPELVDAWRAAIRAGQPPEAMAVLGDLSAVDYAAVRGRIHDVFQAKRPLEIIRLGRDLAEEFREQYRRATEVAREHERRSASAAPL